MKIYDKYGNEYLDIAVDDKSYRYRELKGEDYVQLEFASPTHVELPLRSYIVIDDMQYTLLDMPKITEQHSRNFEYVARFDAPQSMLKLYRFRNPVDGRLKFPITAKPAEHLQMLIDNLAPRNAMWQMGDCIDAPEKVISYDYLTCYDALDLIAATFDTEWEIVGGVISLHKVEYYRNEPLALAYGKDNGLLPGVGRVLFGSTKPLSIVYPQGGERNIDPSTYGNKTLLLPKSVSISYDGRNFDDDILYDESKGVEYITSIDGAGVRRVTPTQNIAEGTLDCTEIYPHREGEVTSVVVRDASQNFYDICDNTIPDALNFEDYRIAGKTMTIVFQSGMLAGREFSVSHYAHYSVGQLSARRFEIVPQEYDGVTMPGGDFIPAIGDTYAIFGIALPDAYIADNATKSGAAWDMFRKCVKHLYENEKPAYSFTGKLDPKFVKRHNIYDRVRVGAYISFTNESFQPEPMLMRVASVKDYINAPHNIEININERAFTPTSHRELIVSNARVNVDLRAILSESRRAEVNIKLLATNAQNTALKVSEGLSVNEKALFGIEKRLQVLEGASGDAVALAKDLTGVLEATPEEFTFRTSAGTKSIRDESAVIRRIKGNTSVWGQLIPPPENWQPYSSSYTSGSVTGGVYRATLLQDFTDGANPYRIGTYLTTPPHTIGHKYFIGGWLKTSLASAENIFSLEMRGQAYNMFPAITSADTWTYVGRVFTLADLGSQMRIYLRPSWHYVNNGLAGNWYEAKDFVLIDLTALYDAGNEPSGDSANATVQAESIKQFKRLYPESYYPYCEPEVRSMRATGIETIGANAFDKDNVVGGLINADGTVTSSNIYSVAKIEVVPYEKYTLTNVANAANTTYTYALYDSEDRFISVGEIKVTGGNLVVVSGDVAMPATARYMRVVVHNDYLDSCCVNLKHSGTLTAEEAVYFKEVRTLPDIAKYFPDGMQGIGELYDEINEENAVKRLGVVDLGTLTWRYDATYNTFYAIERIFAYTGKAKCTRYEQNNMHPPRMSDKQMSLSSYYYLNAISIKDLDYTDAATFKTAMLGVMLVYELIEPIVTPITEPLQLDYKVADFGTEKMLHILPSSPFRADIVYQFNAEGRIRDNARNIERLEEHTKNMATMEDVIERIPTAIATATERVTTWPSDNRLMANVLVDMSETSTAGVLSILGFVGGSSDYSFDDVWRIRFAGLSSSLEITPTIRWANGQAPSFNTWAICDIEFRRPPGPSGYIIGEWKIYR